MLNTNAFFSLGISPRDNKESISESFDELVADGTYDEEQLHQALRTLMASKSRLGAELSWFPDLSPTRCKQISEIINTELSPTEIILLKGMLSELSGISKANLASHVCLKKLGDIDFLTAVVSAQSEISVITAKSEINANRKIAGFPEVDDLLVSELLEKQKQDWIESSISQISVHEHPGNLMTNLLKEFYEGDLSTKRFLEKLLERYENLIVQNLRNYEDTIDKLIIEIKENEDQDRSLLVDSIINELMLWDEYAQPSQLISSSKGLDEPRSKKIYDLVRDLVIWLANEEQEYELSHKLSLSAKNIFAELPAVSNKIEEDIIQLEELIADAKVTKETEILFSLIVHFIEDDESIREDLRRDGFHEGGSGDVSKLYLAFINACKFTKNSDHENEPWELMRAFAIRLNNEKEDPEAAKAILVVLHNMKPPKSIADRLEADINTVSENCLGVALQTRIEIENAIRKSGPEWMAGSTKNDLKNYDTGWIIFILVIGGLILFPIINSSIDNSGPSSKIDYSNQEKKKSDIQQRVQIAPSINGQNNTLTDSELRWCLYQLKRLSILESQFPKNDYDKDPITKFNAGLVTEEIADKYGALVDDYNSRCYDTKYLDSSWNIVNAELSDYRILNKLSDESKAILHSWNQGFIFKE